jgi:hypothetical protein
MATIIILAAVFAVVIVFVAVIWLRTRRSERDEAGHGPATRPMTLIRDDAKGAMPQPRPGSEDFDSGATMIYGRPEQGGTPVAKQREHMPDATPTNARLICLAGGHKGGSFPIPPGGVTIGRATTCDIVLTDPRVSSRHAWVGFVDGKAMLRDLKSTNGTFLNARLNEPVSEAPLRSGDTIFFGGHQGDQFRFVVV